MNRRKMHNVFIITLFILLTIISGCIGSPGCKIIFENQTNETLTVFYYDSKIGTVKPTSQITYDHASWDLGEYQITAKNL